PDDSIASYTHMRKQSQCAKEGGSTCAESTHVRSSKKKCKCKGGSEEVGD
ncbi:hypothetical protein WUBG_11089, partial [Wuchereria bancrofti]